MAQVVEAYAVPRGETLDLGAVVDVFGNPAAVVLRAAVARGEMEDANFHPLGGRAEGDQWGETAPCFGPWEVQILGFAAAGRNVPVSVVFYRDRETLALWDDQVAPHPHGVPAAIPSVPWRASLVPLRPAMFHLGEVVPSAHVDPSAYLPLAGTHTGCCVPR